MKLGNVIFENDLINHKEVDYINYYKETRNLITKDNVKDFSLPTLYVGWGFMKYHEDVNENIRDANILNKQITPNLFWEFSFKEDKENHVKGVERFVNNIPRVYFNLNYRYTNIDPVFLKLFNINDLFSQITYDIDGVYLLKNRMLYIHSGYDIYGLDMDMFRLFKFDINEIEFRLNKRLKSGGVFYNDSEGETYEYFYKKFPNFSHLKRYLVVLMTK